MVVMTDILIEEAAKAIFYRDMVDGMIDAGFYDIWTFETEPNVSTGEKIRAKYKQKAIEHLKFIGVDLKKENVVTDEKLCPYFKTECIKSRCLAFRMGDSFDLIRPYDTCAALDLVIR